MKNRKGFTLIEIIITLILIGIVGATAYGYFGKMIAHSDEPVRKLINTLALHEAMENIIADYNYRFKPSVWRASTHYETGALIIPPPTSLVPLVWPDYFKIFQCTKTGTSNSTALPSTTWPINCTPGTITEGSVDWKLIYMIWQPNYAYIANDIVVPTGTVVSRKGFAYITSAGFTSGTTEPVWYSSVNTNLLDDNILAPLVWQQVGSGILMSDLTRLQTALNTPTTFATYNTRSVTSTQIKTSSFIKFVGGAEQANIIGTDANVILKVILENSLTRETLTNLFFSAY